MYLCHILLVLCFQLYSSSASTTLGKVGAYGTCVNPTTLSFIENLLTNLSTTSLSQLSLLEEMAVSCKKLCKDTNSSIPLLLLLISVLNLILLFQALAM